jgi:hypothetical protein
MLQFAIHEPAHHTQIKINPLYYFKNIICSKLKAGIFLSATKKERKRQEKTASPTHAVEPVLLLASTHW